MGPYIVPLCKTNFMQWLLLFVPMCVRHIFQHIKGSERILSMTMYSYPCTGGCGKAICHISTKWRSDNRANDTVCRYCHFPLLFETLLDNAPTSLQTTPTSEISKKKHQNIHCETTRSETPRRFQKVVTAYSIPSLKLT